MIFNLFQLGDIQAAKRYCILHNRWNIAFRLSTKYKLLDIPDLFAKHCLNMSGENNLEKSVEINMEAGYYKHAAEHTFRVNKLTVRLVLCFISILSVGQIGKRKR